MQIQITPNIQTENSYASALRVCICTTQHIITTLGFVKNIQCNISVLFLFISAVFREGVILTTHFTTKNMLVRPVEPTTAITPRQACEENFEIAQKYCNGKQIVQWIVEKCRLYDAECKDFIQTVKSWKEKTWNVCLYRNNYPGCHVYYRYTLETTVIELLR